MKKTFWDFFSREFEVRFSVSPRDTINARDTQLAGVSLLSPDGEGSFPVKEEAGIETTFDLLRKLRPDILRFSADSPDFDRWIKFCKAEEIHPHLCFCPDTDPDKALARIKQCAAEFGGNDLWQPIRFYEVLCDPETIRFEDDGMVEERIQAVLEFSGMLRASDPDAKIIIGGIAPIGEKRTKAEIWNCGILQKCPDVMDMIGVSLQPSLPSERTWDEDAEGIELRVSLAEQVRMGLQRMDRQIRESAPDSEIRIAVTGWRFLPDAISQKRLDSIYYSAVYRSIRMAGARVMIHESAPLFGSGSLLRCEDGKVFGDVFYHHQLLVSPDLPVCLEAKEPDFEKPVPVYRWEGIPGILEGGELKMAEIHASRSMDGKRLFFLVTNRSPFRRCVMRVRFYDLPDLHPIRAFIVKSARRQDAVSSEQPENVYCKEVRLGNYRRMNHVTIEIPECTSVCMLLE